MRAAFLDTRMECESEGPSCDQSSSALSMERRETTVFLDVDMMSVALFKQVETSAFTDCSWLARVKLCAEEASFSADEMATTAA